MMKKKTKEALTKKFKKNNKKLRVLSKPKLLKKSTIKSKYVKITPIPPSSPLLPWKFQQRYRILNLIMLSSPSKQISTFQHVLQSECKRTRGYTSEKTYYAGKLKIGNRYKKSANTTSTGRGNDKSECYINDFIFDLLFQTFCLFVRK